MKLKVELLIKEELTYELLGRAVTTFSEESTAQDLRKLLRSHQTVPFNPANFQKGLIIEDEFNLVEEKLVGLESYVKELNPRAVSKILRAETKLNHVELRCKTILRFKISDENKKRCEELLIKVEELKGLIEKVGVDELTKERAFRKLSETMAEEENLDDVFSSVNIDGPSVKVVHQTVATTGNVNTSPVNSLINGGDCSTNTEVGGQIGNPILSSATSAVGNNLPMVIDMSKNTGQDYWGRYSKLPNPVERYLKGLKTTNGLSVNELLNFIKVILKMSTELKLSDHSILELCCGHSFGPLLNKLLELKGANASLEKVHLELLRCFLPINLRENLRRSMVNRPQRVGEPLGIYCDDIKENAKTLLCPYSESELVEIIKLGISPQDRSRLVFMSNPTTFADLELLCIQVQNMAYSDHIRSSESNRGTHLVQSVEKSEMGNRQAQRPIVCYFCQKEGHIARNCFSRNKQFNQSKNESQGGNL